MLGSSNVQSLVLTVVYGAVTTLGVITCGFWLDKVGRRTALVSRREISNSPRSARSNKLILWQLACYAGMIPAMAFIVGFWIPFEASGNQSLGLAKGILVGVYLVCFTFSGVMNAFGPTVRRLLGVILPSTHTDALAVRIRDHAYRDSRSWAG